MSQNEENSLSGSDPARTATEPRQVRVFSRGSCKFAVFADDLTVVASWRRPTPLPQAPPAVLGVVSLQGRMLTVLDPAALLDQATQKGSSPSFIVALRGDEQLALAVDETGETLAADITAQNDKANDAALGIIMHNGDTISVLDVKKLFGLAIRGRERRKRRF